ncbi:MAG TPA: hypothetical protein VFU96_00050 [Acidimicrobiia bacterium]|nr:hypothetical protein [Acidimicrobiia bacterium]
MKFTGQVRVPEVDHPGVPATIVIEEGQTEVFLEGESLGRWSLYDVRAARLVSSAFSLDLDGEEITFIADEPVDFAYKGVDHMAGVWARYKSMTIPRRVVAVGRSRRGTLPSRISELREAMLSNLQTAGRPTARFAAFEAPPVPVEPAPWTKRLDAYSNVPEPIDTDPIDDGPLALAPTVIDPISEPEIEEALAEIETDDTAEPETRSGLEPTSDEVALGIEPVLDEADGTVETDETAETDDVPALAAEIEPNSAPAVASIEVETSRAQLRPGPGLIPRRVQRPRDEEEMEPSISPFWDEAWAEPPIEDEPYDDVPPDADLVLIDNEPPVAAAAVVEVGEDVDLAADQVEPIVAEETAAAPAAPAPWEATHDDALEEPVSVDEWAVAPQVEEAIRPEVVVDLDHLHVEPTSVESDLELLFAGAPTPEGEKSGLLGAVRSAFARNKTTHEHEFVEAPGGIGIVRQICADCGYISIGVSD